MTDEYQEFLASKLIKPVDAGFECSAVNAILFPFQRDIVRWCLRKGRAAIFAECGLGKTGMQLEWAKRVAEHTGGKVLVLAPLAVAAQTQREGVKFGIEVKIVRDASDEHSAVSVANYEILHRLNPSDYVGVVLDESSILKAFSGKVKRSILKAFEKTQYKLACTATPAPNDPMELGNHCEFLGVMTSHKMLTRWFLNDTMAAGKWRLKGHAERDYWQWVATWAVGASKPSDLGYSDDGYNLPPLEIKQHTVNVDITTACEEDRDGQLALFREPTLSATTLHKELRRTAPDRAQRVAELVASTDTPWMVWCNTNYEAEELRARIPEAVEITGSDSLEKKEQRVLDYCEGRIRVLISKPSILSFGLNFQHVSNMAFVGLSYSYEQFYQALRRSYRFGQTKPVTAHVIAAATEGAIGAIVRQKQQEHEKMKEQMAEAVKEARLANTDALETSMDYRRNTSTANGWEMRLGDSVELARELPDDSLDFVIYSPPFSNLYTYSDSYRDMGNSDNDAEFFKHYSFLLTNIFRATKPGRLMAVHVKQVVNYKGTSGAAGLRDFRGDVIRACIASGFVYHSEVCIWKCPVTEMQRTKSHGLLYKQLRKDSTYSRQGLAEYLLVFRKWGEEDAAPVTKTHESFPVELWQKYASPVWMDIDQTDVLNARNAGDPDDEKHICPLQLGVIERALQLWTNPGDLVFSPFAGIGSEGYVSINEGRRFLGFELKEAYYETAIKNLTRAATQKNAQGDLFYPSAIGG